MTDTEAKKFYDSKAWQTKRIEILKRDRFECQDCRARIQKAVAEGKWLPEKEKKIARKEGTVMIKLIRITFFRGWTKQQVIDFTLALTLTVVSLTATIVLMHIFG